MNYKKDKIDYITAAVFIILIAFVPLIVRAQQINVSTSEYGFLRVSKEVTDIFSYYKNRRNCLDAVSETDKFNHILGTVNN